MKKLRNILALTVISLALFSCDTEMIQKRIDSYKKDKNNITKVEHNNDARHTGGNGDDPAKDKDD
ncbi:MAG: hypothetical protein HRT68_03720 [Flavobacteriaceae bacterium]|nr:hypothetical protein [Flavobacteriaceae bacterium]